MTNNNTVKITALLLLASVCSPQARVVLSKEKQGEILSTARLLLSDPTDSKKTVPDELHDPFHIVVVEDEPIEEVVEETVEVQEINELSESEILSLVAQKLKPSGVIDQGGQRYLILNGKTVQDGVSFNFPHEGIRYAIEISQIQTNSFTLNLNSESKTISME